MGHVPAPLSGEGSCGPATPFAPRPQVWERCFAIEADSVLRARLHVRTWLTVISWRGDQDEGTRIVDVLVTNAVEHVRPRHPAEEIGLGLSVDEDETLLVAVTDPSPTFPDFKEALSAEGTGFALVQQLGGELQWFISQDVTTKTVQALIRYRPLLPDGSH